MGKRPSGRYKFGIKTENRVRVTNLPKFYALSQAFPKVDIVTSLLIRRQFYRKIAANSLGKLLRETFTCLPWFRHEVWQDVNPQEQSRFEKGT